MRQVTAVAADPDQDRGMAGNRSREDGNDASGQSRPADAPVRATQSLWQENDDHTFTLAVGPAAAGHPPGTGHVPGRRRGAVRRAVERVGGRRLRARVPQPVAASAARAGRVLQRPGLGAARRAASGVHTARPRARSCSTSRRCARSTRRRPIRRFVQSIIEARGDFNGKVLSLRYDDLKALCTLVGGDIPTGVAQLRTWGVMVDGPEIPDADSTRAGADQRSDPPGPSATGLATGPGRLYRLRRGPRRAEVRRHLGR